MSAQPAPQSEIEIGNIRLSYVPDGVILIDPVASYPGTTAQYWAQHDDFLDSDGLLVMSVGSILVRTSDHCVLIDLGVGPRTTDMASLSDGKLKGLLKGGELLGNLAALGLCPDDIDTVLFSHLHPDHVGWVAGSESVPRPTFAHATHYLAKSEFEHWREPGNAGGLGAPTRAELDVIASRVGFLADGDSPVPGITVLATPGHTTGHHSFIIGDGPADRAIVLGDAVHCPLELNGADLGFVGDHDAEQAKASRHRLATALAEPGTVVVGPHFPGQVFRRFNPALTPALPFLEPHR
jgi:glyoxylase-like metal-dependent hydrolase (beta-lactamase superfamily II)